jgi:methylated-DNA-protein-cysteine methyltransferase-like protein
MHRKVHHRPAVSDKSEDAGGIHHCNKRGVAENSRKTPCPPTVSIARGTGDVAICCAMKPKDNLFKLFLAQIRRIPRGKVATYGDIAYAAGYPGYARQVAWALHGAGRTVPWQRVVGSGGKILLTGEHGFEQRFRLEAEGVRLIGLRVDMKAHHHSFFKKKASQPKKKPAEFSLRKKAAKPRKRAARKKAR